MTLKGYKIFIDAGHGGSDPGAVYGSLYEKNLTLNIAKRLQTRLNALGATTKMSRTGDTYPTLAQRSSASNSFKANIFVSIHINSGGGTGVETLVHPNASNSTKSLAKFVNDRLASGLGVTNRLVKHRSNVYVINPANTNAWAILPEVLFIDTAADRAKLQNATNLQKAANAIANGIQSFTSTLPPIN